MEKGSQADSSESNEFQTTFFRFDWAEREDEIIPIQQLEA